MIETLIGGPFCGLQVHIAGRVAIYMVVIDDHPSLSPMMSAYDRCRYIRINGRLIYELCGWDDYVMRDA